MVSGILMGDISGRIKGEIIVFTLKNQKLRICARISNRVSAYVKNHALISPYSCIREIIRPGHLCKDKIKDLL